MTHRSSLPTRALALIAAAGLSACATPSSAPRPSPAAQQASMDAPLINRSEVVAVVSSGEVATELEQTAARWGYALLRKESLDGLGLFLMTFDCPPGIDPREASLELERLTPRATVEANHRFDLQAQTAALPPPGARLYANRLIGWPDDGCDPLTRVGMIDGAVPADRFPGAVTRDFVEEPSPAARDHGIAVAELLTGDGRLRGVQLHAASVVADDANGAAYSGVEPILRALDWMVREDVSVVNVSLAGPYNETLAEGFARAAERGVVVVAAVGNSGPDAAPRYPAALPSTIAATAVDSRSEIYAKAVRGDHVDVAAPGVDVFAAGRYQTGTSMAAPFVTARLAADRGVRSVADARARLSRTTRDLGDAGPDPVYGMGLLSIQGRCPAP